eukprot:11534217-Alexandrium_andersonii.AAC.1
MEQAVPAPVARWRMAFWRGVQRLLCQHEPVPKPAILAQRHAEATAAAHAEEVEAAKAELGAAGSAGDAVASVAVPPAAAATASQSGRTP